jgi:hypothetical protein
MKALEMRRLDIIELLVEHACDPRMVDMMDVFRSWDPKIIEFFISRSGNVVEDQPFAQAFCERIRAALRPYKDLLSRMPELQEQANVALRYHCKDGNIKWVSLLLWVGADPCKPGSVEPGEEWTEEDDGLSALGYAALYNNYEVFNLKPIRTRPFDPQSADYVRYLNRGDGIQVLRRLLE